MSVGRFLQSRWAADADLRLFCLPHAGGGTAGFHRWRSAVPAAFDLLPVSLPGHDGRLTEAPCTDLCVLARDLADELVSAIDRPYALIGHSLGAWIAFEIAREVRRRRRPLPLLLVVAAARPPDSPMPEPLLHRLPDDELIAAVAARYGGIPPAVAASAELLELILPGLRADIQMAETYRYVPEPPLDAEILALGGTEDPAVSTAQLAEWRRHAVRDCSVRQFPGGHFFLFRSEAHSVKTAASDPASPALEAILHALKRYASHGAQSSVNNRGQSGTDRRSDV